MRPLWRTASRCKLSTEQAAYYFLSGYTAKMAGTEVGEKIEPTFSTCFGAPFFPRPASIYADLLIALLKKHPCPVYLVNTGWSGDTNNGGKRFSIPTTRSIIHAIQNHSIEKVEFEILPGFNLHIPKTLIGVDNHLLDPRKAWQDTAAYDATSKILIQKFIENFKKYSLEKIAACGPTNP